ncbi:MAG: hypothetical protein AB7G75_28565 [Candidatus Binatia bacterium]
MATLPSGLEEIVADDEDLARYLTSSSQFNAVMVKPAAFLPNPKDRETSVFRHGSEPRDRLWAIGFEHAAGDRNVHGAAICKAHHVREAQLEVTADEPPPRHAAIRGWPFSESDPELQKARQKELAALIASKAEVVRR